MARLGIYGGSFNPPHTGHVLAAEQMCRLLGLDQLLVIPAGQPPHKQLDPGSPTADQRLELTKLAFAGVPGAQVLDLELRREGKSYTVDTLTELHARYPGDELVLIMGTDMLLSFTGWRSPEAIAALATLAVVHRSDDPTLWQQVRNQALHLELELDAKVELVENDSIEISSTTVRRLLAMKTPAYLPPAVEERIRVLGLYRWDEDFTGLPFDRLREVSLSLHDEKRRPHVVGTSDTAMALAERWGEDPALARRAGILHDITKALGPTEQLRLCKKYDIVPSQAEQESLKLLHAKTGAAVARHVFGEDEALASAIRWHTTGRANMTLLEKIIYIADYMEPNRRFSGVEVLRDLVWRDLDAAVREGLRMSLEQLERQGRTVDPNSAAAWQYFCNERSHRP